MSNKSWKRMTETSKDQDKITGSLDSSPAPIRDRRGMTTFKKHYG